MRIATWSRRNTINLLNIFPVLLGVLRQHLEERGCVMQLMKM